MTLKEITKRFQRLIARKALRVCSLIIKFLPEAAVYSLADFLARVGYILAIKQRKIALESLSIAFAKEKDKIKIQDIAKLAFQNMAKGMVELIYLMERPNLIKERVKIEGKKHLDNALKQGKGVIGVSAHFGNFPLMLLRLRQEGFKTNAIIRYARDEKIEKYFQQKRTSLGLNTIYSQPRKVCVDKSIKALRDNEFLFIPLDQNFGTGGVFVEFFGRQAATATGPVILAKRTQAPIVPMFIIREKDNTHKIIIEPPLYIEEKEDSQKTVTFNIARITKIIENYIRSYPQEWGWIHRRWKSQMKT
ncbi:MAG: lysophospholipid acyltransferase family protein [Candidatus Omnitrophota bacterium]|nr:lysophospholipid acyltransferase family protein [Candidatus Omnitrophota bacterium]